jgi:hypothetical protein
MNVTGPGGSGSCSINNILSLDTLTSSPWKQIDWETKARTERIVELSTWITSNIIKRANYLNKPWTDQGIYDALTYEERKVRNAIGNTYAVVPSREQMFMF